MSAAHDYNEDPYEVQQRLIAEMNAAHDADMRQMDAEDAIDQAAYQRVADDMSDMDRIIAELAAENAAFTRDDSDGEDDGGEEGEPAGFAGSPEPSLAPVGRGGFRYV